LDILEHSKNGDVGHGVRRTIATNFCTAITLFPQIIEIDIFLRVAKSRQQHLQSAGLFDGGICFRPGELIGFQTQQEIITFSGRNSVPENLLH